MRLCVHLLHHNACTSNWLQATVCAHSGLIQWQLVLPCYGYMYLDSGMPPPKSLTLIRVSFKLFNVIYDAACADAEEGLSVEVHALSNDGLHVANQPPHCTAACMMRCTCMAVLNGLLDVSAQCS